MFKQKIKTESEVFSEQRYKDAAVIIYYQMKKKNQPRNPHLAANEQDPTKAPVQGWVYEHTTGVSRNINDTPQNSGELVEYMPVHVQSKFCTLV